MTATPAIRYAFTGNSGAELTLMELGGKSFVRKRAHIPEQSIRLRQQCEKLRHAHESGIACPAVYRADESDGLFSFDMEFVPGDSLAHILISGRLPDWDVLLPQITALIECYCGTGDGEIPASQFITKLDSIFHGCIANRAVQSELCGIEAAIVALKQLDWSGVPASQSHGDLTLENLLVQQNGRVVFIDFDVPEQCSWWLDIAKLFQDLLGHWCLRDLIVSNPESVEASNAQLAMSRAAAVTSLLAADIAGGADRLAPFVAFHLLRTLPYARDPLLVHYVVQRIHNVVMRPSLRL